MKITGLQLSEKLFGRSLLQILRIFTIFAKKKKIYTDRKEVKNILIIRTGGLGDGILAVPFLKKLKSSFKDCRITLICIRRNKVVFADLPYIDQSVIIDDLRYLFSNLRHIFVSRYDAIFDLEPIHRLPTALSFLIKSTIKVGFDTDGRRHFYTHFVNYNQTDYEADNFLRQLEVFGIKAESAKGKLDYPIKNKYVIKAEELLKEKGVEPAKGFLIAISLGTLNEQNRWPTQKFCKLIRKILIYRDDFKIILIGGKEDSVESEKLLQSFKNQNYKQRIINFSGKTNFRMSLAILKCCNLFIGHDAGPLHMAVSTGLPTVSFFGSAIENRWNPGGKYHIGLNKNYHCSPCRRGRFSMLPRCPYQYSCIRDITVDETFVAFRDLLRYCAEYARKEPDQYVRRKTI